MQKLETIPLESILIPKSHIRVQSIDEKAIAKLAESILSAGLLVRIIVRSVNNGRYELVDGERRLHAVESLYEKEGRKWIGIPAIVEDMTPKEAIRRQVVINENRQDLTPFEKAKRLQNGLGYRLFQEHPATILNGRKVPHLCCPVNRHLRQISPGGPRRV